MSTDVPTVSVLVKLPKAEAEVEFTISDLGERIVLKADPEDRVLLWGAVDKILTVKGGRVVSAESGSTLVLRGARSYDGKCYGWVTTVLHGKWTVNKEEQSF